MTRTLRAVVLAIFCTATGLMTQTSSPDTIFIHARVTDSKKAPAVGLKTENFQVWEDGVEQKISSFSDSGEPWDIHFILLTAGNGNLGRTSINEDIAARIVEAVSSFRKTESPKSTYSIEASPDTIAGDSEFWPTMDRNLAALEKSANPKRALIVVTTGFDHGFGSLPGLDSRFDDRFHSRSKRVDDPNVPVYIIFLRTQTALRGGSDLAPTHNSMYDAVTKGSVLIDLVNKTRGDYYLISPDKVESQFLQLATDLNNDYVVGFKSTNGAKNNTWRKLKMKVTTSSGQNLAASIKDKYFVQKP